MTETNKDGQGRLKNVRKALLNSSATHWFQEKMRVPDALIQFFRATSDPSKEDPDLQHISNPYRYAKERLNKIWRGKEAYDNVSTSPVTPSPVSSLTSMRGALTAYWTSERWAQGWMATGATIGLTTLTAANAVWMAEAVAGVASSVAQLVNPTAENQTEMIVDSIQTLALFGGVQIGSVWGMFRLRGFIERDMSHWMRSRFKEAALENPDMVQRLTHNTDRKIAGGVDSEENTAQDIDLLPDSPHERIGQAPEQMARNVMNMMVGSWAAVATSAFVAAALIEKSVPVPLLDELGDKINSLFPAGTVDFMPGEYGTAVAAAMVITGYLGITVPTGLSITKQLEENFKKMQAASGKMSETLVHLFQRGESIAASQGHEAFKTTLENHIDEVREIHGDQNKKMSNYYAFMGTHSFVGYNIISLIPALAPLYKAGGQAISVDPVKTIFETQGLVGALLSSMSSVIEILPSLAEMKSAASRITDMANHFELASDKQAFYALSGIHEFKNPALLDDECGLALKINNLHLMHRGQEAAFVSFPKVQIAQNDWVHVSAPPGQGKSSFIKSVAGLWPYGRGDIAMHEGAQLFYTHQKTDIVPNQSLAHQLMVGQPYDPNDPLTQTMRDDMRIALSEAGLGDYADQLDDKGIAGKTWDKTLSGGQQQRLVLARILYQKPDILLLDEPTSELDIHGKDAFFSALKNHCPDSTIIAITHDGKTPQDMSGLLYFNKRLSIENNVGTLSCLESADMSDKQDDTSFVKTDTIGPPAKDL